MMGLPYGEEIMIVGRTMWTQCTNVTDRQIDRQTDKITITKTVQRRASHGKNLSRDVHVSVNYGESVIDIHHWVLLITKAANK